MIYNGWLMPGALPTLDVRARIALMRAVKSDRGLDLAIRPQGWKFDQKSSALLPDVPEFGGLSVGDAVGFRQRNPAYDLGLWGLEPHSTLVPAYPVRPVFTLLSFARIVGAFKKSRVRMEAMGCVLALSEESRQKIESAVPVPVPHFLGDYMVPVEEVASYEDALRHREFLAARSDRPIRDADTEKVLLFWARSLQKA